MLEQPILNETTAPRPLSVGVFCSSRDTSPPASELISAVEQVGAAIGLAGADLIFGGCNVGLMRRLADSARAEGSRVVGVVLARFVSDGIAYTEADELVVAESVFERRRIFEERAHAFLVLPGGYGTLAEFMSVMDQVEAGHVRKPIAVVNVEGFFDLWHEFATQLRRRGMISTPPVGDIYNLSDPSGVTPLLATWADELGSRAKNPPT